MVKDMYIESIELNNYRNYRKLKVEFGKIQIYSTAITPRARQIYLNLYTWQPQQNRTGVQRIEIS